MNRIDLQSNSCLNTLKARNVLHILLLIRKAPKEIKSLSRGKAGKYWLAPCSTNLLRFPLSLGFTGSLDSTSDVTHMLPLVSKAILTPIRMSSINVKHTYAEDNHGGVITGGRV